MIGKDYAVGGIVPWWLLTRPDSLVVVTGPSQTILGSVTWKEIKRALDEALIPFGGKLSNGIKASPQLVEIAPGWQALGFATTSVERASGQHAPQLLVVVEEASGVEEEIWQAIDSLGYERLLAIGNPIRAEGKFVDLIRQAEKDRCDRIPDSRATNAIQVPSTQSPHATWEKSPWGIADRPWLETMYRKYGKNSLWVASHIDAKIPTVDAEQLIPEAWFNWAVSQTRKQAGPGHPIHATRRIACDLSEGVGRDSTCVMVRDDWGVLDVVVGSNIGLAKAAAIIAEKANQYSVEHNRITFDVVGVGRTMPNHLARYGIKNAMHYAGEGSPREKIFTNLRTECGWKLRNRLNQEHAPDIRAPHMLQVPFTFAPGAYIDRLRDELRPLTYSLAGGHQTKLLSKEDWSEVLGHSPDVADTILQSFCF
jgi:phage terminase large subunit